MSAVVKQEQYELEQKIHSFLPDPGVQAIRDWCISARDALNLAWPRMSGEGLMQAQGCAANLNDLLRIIDNGPKIRPAAAKPNGGIQ